MTTTPITIVTGNANKLREIEALAPAGLQFTSQKIDLDEIQSLDLRAIVEHKLRQAYALVKTPVAVEDVSAELASLNGLPGPFVKFFVQQLEGSLYQLTKAENDTVTIRCLAGYFDGVNLLFGEGILPGIIVPPRGDNGFGFDPVVQPDGSFKTLAEMTTDEKNAISHRARAFRDLFNQVGALK